MDVPGPPRRGLTVPRFSRAPASGVWYYHVDVAVHDPSPSASPSASASASASAAPPTAVYSVLRRYSDFLELYELVQAELVLSALHDRAAGPAAMPAFPAKETIPPGLLGPLGRLATPRAVLERRRARFQQLLQWLERHPAACASAALDDFLGPPPQEPDGYTSLKEYAAPHWLKAVQLAAAKGRDKDRDAGRPRRSGRTRAYTMDALEGRRGSVSSNASSVKSEPPRPAPPLALAVVSPRDEDEDKAEPEQEPAARGDKPDARPEGAARPSRHHSRVLYVEPRRRDGRP